MQLPAHIPSAPPANRDVACDVALEAVAALPAQPSKPARWNRQRDDAHVDTP